MADNPGSEEAEAGVDWTMNWRWIGYVLMAVLFGLLYRCFRAFFAFLLKLYRRTLAWVNPKYKRRLALLQWIEKRTERKVDGFWELWENPEILSNVVNGVIPVAYIEDPYFETTRHATLQQIQALVSRYFDVRPMFLGEELKRPWNKRVENKFIRLLHVIKASIERLEHTSKQEDAGEYVARGMGLIAGTRGHPTAFFVYSRHELDFDSMRIRITGPGADTIQINITGTRDNAQKHDNPLRVSYEVIENAGSLQDGVKKCLRVTYTPNHTGEYKLDITKQGYIILGSPFNVTVEMNNRTTIQSNIASKPETRVIHRVVDFVNEKMLLTDKGELIKITSDPSGALAKLKTQMDEQSAVAISLARILQKEARPTPDVFFEVCEYIMKTCHFILKNSSCSKGLRLVSGANKLISGDSLLLDDGVRTEVAHTEREMKKLLQARVEQTAVVQTERETKKLIQTLVTKPPEQSIESSKDPDVMFLDRLLSEGSEVSRSRSERRRQFGRKSPNNKNTTVESLEDDVFTDSRNVLISNRPLSTENLLRPNIIVNRSQMTTPDIVYVNLLETEENVTCRQIDISVKSAPRSLDGFLSAEHSVIKAKEFFRHNKDVKDKVVMDLETDFFKSVEESLATDESSSLSETERCTDSGTFSTKSTVLVGKIKSNNETFCTSNQTKIETGKTTASKTFTGEKSNTWMRETGRNVTEKIEVKTVKTAKITLKKQERVPDENGTGRTENTFSNKKSFENSEALQNHEILRVNEDLSLTKSKEIESIEITKANISVRKIICDFEKMLQAQNEQVETIIKTILDQPAERSLTASKKSCVTEETNVFEDKNYVSAKNLLSSSVGHGEQKPVLIEITQPIKNQNDITVTCDVIIPEPSVNDNYEKDAVTCNHEKSEEKLLLPSTKIPTVQSNDHAEAESELTYYSKETVIQENQKSDASQFQENGLFAEHVEVLEGKASLLDGGSCKDDGFLLEETGKSELDGGVETGSGVKSNEEEANFQTVLLKTVVAPFASRERDNEKRANGGVREEILEIGKTLVEALMKHPIQRDVVRSIIKQISIDRKLSAESVHMFLRSFEESNAEFSPVAEKVFSEITADAVAAYSKESASHKIGGEEERGDKTVKKSDSEEGRFQTENLCSECTVQHNKGNQEFGSTFEPNLTVNNNKNLPQISTDDLQVSVNEKADTASKCNEKFSDTSEKDEAKNSCFDLEDNSTLMENELLNDGTIRASLEDSPKINTEKLTEENHKPGQGIVRQGEVSPPTEFTQSENAESKTVGVPSKSNEPQSAVEQHFNAFQDKKEEHHLLNPTLNKKIGDSATLKSAKSTKLISQKADLPETVSQFEISCTRKSGPDERDSSNLIRVNDKSSVEDTASRTLNYDEKVEGNENLPEETSNEISSAREKEAVDQDSSLLKLDKINTGTDVSLPRDRDIVNGKSSEREFINISSLNSSTAENIENVAGNHIKNLCSLSEKEEDDFRKLDSTIVESRSVECKLCQNQCLSAENQTNILTEERSFSANALDLQDKNTAEHFILDKSDETSKVLDESHTETTHYFAKQPGLDKNPDYMNVMAETDQCSESQNIFSTSESKVYVEPFNEDHKDTDETDFEAKCQHLVEEKFVLDVLDVPISTVAPNSEELPELTKPLSTDESNQISKSIELFVTEETEKLEFLVQLEAKDISQVSDGADVLVNDVSEKPTEMSGLPDKVDAVFDLTEDMKVSDTTGNEESNEVPTAFKALTTIESETSNSLGIPDVEDINKSNEITKKDSSEVVTASKVLTDVAVEEANARLGISDLAKTDNFEEIIPKRSDKVTTASGLLTNVATEEVDASLSISDLIKTDEPVGIIAKGSDEELLVSKVSTDFVSEEACKNVRVCDSERSDKIKEIIEDSRNQVDLVLESHDISACDQFNTEITEVGLTETSRTSCDPELLSLEINTSEIDSHKREETVAVASTNIETVELVQKSETTPQKIELSTEFKSPSSSFSPGDEIFSTKENIKCKLCSDHPNLNDAFSSTEETHIKLNAKIKCKLCSKQTDVERSTDSTGSVIDSKTEIDAEGAGSLPDMPSEENQQSLTGVNVDSTISIQGSKSRRDEADEKRIPNKTSEENHQSSEDLNVKLISDTVLKPAEPQIIDHSKDSEETRLEFTDQLLNRIDVEKSSETPENQGTTTDYSPFFSNKIEMISEESTLPTKKRMSVVKREKAIVLVDDTDIIQEPTFEVDKIQVSKSVIHSTDEISTTVSEVNASPDSNLAIVTPAKDTVLKIDDRTDESLNLLPTETLVSSVALAPTEETILKSNDEINELLSPPPADKLVLLSVVAADTIVKSDESANEPPTPLSDETLNPCLTEVTPTNDFVLKSDDKTGELVCPLLEEKLPPISAVAASAEDTVLRSGEKTNDPPSGLPKGTLGTYLAVGSPAEDTIFKSDNKTSELSCLLPEETLVSCSVMKALTEDIILKSDDKTNEPSNSLPKEALMTCSAVGTTTDEAISESDNQVYEPPGSLPEEALMPFSAVEVPTKDNILMNDDLTYQPLGLFSEEKLASCLAVLAPNDEISLKGGNKTDEISSPLFEETLPPWSAVTILAEASILKNEEKTNDLLSSSRKEAVVPGSEVLAPNEEIILKSDDKTIKSPVAFPEKTLVVAAIVATIEDTGLKRLVESNQPLSSLEVPSHDSREQIETEYTIANISPPSDPTAPLEGTILEKNILGSKTSDVVIGDQLQKEQTSTECLQSNVTISAEKPNTTILEEAEVQVSPKFGPLSESGTPIMEKNEPHLFVENISSIEPKHESLKPTPKKRKNLETKTLNLDDSSRIIKLESRDENSTKVCEAKIEEKASEYGHENVKEEVNPTKDDQTVVECESMILEELSGSVKTETDSESCKQISLEENTSSTVNDITDPNERMKSAVKEIEKLHDKLSGIGNKKHYFRNSTSSLEVIADLMETKQSLIEIETDLKNVIEVNVNDEKIKDDHGAFNEAQQNITSEEVFPEVDQNDSIENETTSKIMQIILHEKETVSAMKEENIAEDKPDELDLIGYDSTAAEIQEEPAPHNDTNDSKLEKNGGNTLISESDGLGDTLDVIKLESVPRENEAAYSKESASHKIGGEEERGDKIVKKSDSEECRFQTENLCSASTVQHNKGNQEFGSTFKPNLTVNNNKNLPQISTDDLQVSVIEKADTVSKCNEKLSDTSEKDEAKNSCFDLEDNSTLMENELLHDETISASLEDSPKINTVILTEENHKPGQGIDKQSEMSPPTEFTQSENAESKIVGVPSKSNELQSAVEQHFHALQDDSSRIIKLESRDENSTKVCEAKIEEKASEYGHENVKEELNPTKDDQTVVECESMILEELSGSVKTETGSESCKQISLEENTSSTVNDITDPNERMKSVVKEIDKLRDKLSGIGNKKYSFRNSTSSLEVIADLMETKQSLIEIETDLKNVIEVNVNDEKIKDDHGALNEAQQNITSEEVFPEVDQNDSIENESTSKIMQIILHEKETVSAMKEENIAEDKPDELDLIGYDSTAAEIQEEPAPHNDTNDSKLEKNGGNTLISESDGLGDTLNVIKLESAPRENEEESVIDNAKALNDKPYFSMTEQPDSWFSEAGGECFAEFHTDSLLNNSWLDMKADDLLIWSPSSEAASESCSDSIQVSKELDFESIISAPTLDAALRKLEQKINSAQQMGSAAEGDFNIFSSDEEASKLSPVVQSGGLNTISDNNMQEFVAFGSSQPLFDWKTISAMGPAEREIWGLPSVGGMDAKLPIPGSSNRGTRPNSPSMDTITEALEEQEDEFPKISCVPRKYFTDELPIITLTPEQSVDDVVKKPLSTDESKLSPLNDSRFREDLKILSVLDYMNLSTENAPVYHVENYNNFIGICEEKFSADVSATGLGVEGEKCLGSETDDDSELISESDLISAALLETIGFPDASTLDKGVGDVLIRKFPTVDTSFKILEDRLHLTDTENISNQLEQKSYDDVKSILSSVQESSAVDTNLEGIIKDKRTLIDNEGSFKQPEQTSSTQAEVTLFSAGKSLKKTENDKIDELSTTKLNHSINSSITSLHENEESGKNKAESNRLDGIETNKTPESLEKTLGSSDVEKSLDRIDFKEIRLTIDTFENLSSYQKPKISFIDEIQQIGNRGIEDRIRQFNEINKVKSIIKTNIFTEETDVKEKKNLDSSPRIEESCTCELLKKDLQNVSGKTNIIKEEKDKINEHIAAHDRDVRNSGSNLVAFWKNYWDKVVEENQLKTDPATKSKRRGAAKKARMTITLPITRHELPVLEEEKNSEERVVNYALSEESIENIKQLNIIDRIRLFEDIVATMTLERSKSPTRTEDKCRASTPDFSRCENELIEDHVLDCPEKGIEDIIDATSKTDEGFECFQNKVSGVSTPDFEECGKKLADGNILDYPKKELEKSVCKKDEDSSKDFEFQKNKCFQNKFVKLKEYFELLEKQSTETKPETSCSSCRLETQLQFQCKRRRRKRKSSRRQLAKGVIQSAPTSDSETPAQHSYQLWGSERLKVSDRIHIKELFEDVFNETGWCRGAVPNKEAVLASLRSIDFGAEFPRSFDDDEEDAMNFVELESIRNISNVPLGYQNVYPYIPTTPIHKYRSRPCAEHNLIPRNTLLQILDEN